ncbi:MAG TPA: IS256 family transposase [Fervidobacterium sp.]|nr:IS256 family transposase [Fervidobacterium sp.]
MYRISPKERIDKVFREFLEGGCSGEGSVLGNFYQLAIQKVVQELLEQEVESYLGRGPYERTSEPANKGYRNGYKERSLRSAEGRIPIHLPQLRDTDEPYQSKLWSFLKGNSDVLEYLVAEMYARGLSTRDIEDIFTDEDGHCIMSKSQVSQVTEVLWEEYQSFKNRDLSDIDLVYLFLDAIYEPMRRLGNTREGILCAWGITKDGNRVLLHLDLGNKESFDNWMDFLRDMVKRGLKSPITITTDGAPGLIKAVEQMWSNSIRIRCWAHKKRNVLEKFPESMIPEVRSYLDEVRDAADYARGLQRAQEFIERYERDYRSAVASLKDDLEASLAHLKIPEKHRKYVRTTNLIERAFEEERRRTKVLPRFFDEKSALKLAFSVLWRASLRWQKVRFGEHEQKQLSKLEEQLKPGTRSEFKEKEVAYNLKEVIA